MPNQHQTRQIRRVPVGLFDWQAELGLLGDWGRCHRVHQTSLQVVFVEVVRTLQEPQGHPFRLLCRQQLLME